MSYEFEDYRPRGPKERPKWLEWTPTQPRTYIIIQLLLNFVMPGFIGLTLSAFGMFCNIILIDWILYIRDTSSS